MIRVTIEAANRSGTKVCNNITELKEIFDVLEGLELDIVITVSAKTI